MKKYKKIVNAGLITSAVLFTTWGINKLIFLSAGMKELLFCENRYQYSWRFGNIFYTKKGSGSPILLIHELKSTASAYEWQSAINILAKNHTVYALDLLGCGRSEKPKMTYTNYIFVQLINDFVKDVIGTKTDVITSNSASSIGIMSCYSEPDLYNRLMLINPSSMNVIAKFPKANHKTLKYLIEMPIIGTTIYNLIHLPSEIKRHFKKALARPSSSLSRMTDAMYESCHLGGTSARYFYASERSHFTNINILHALKKLNHSICVIGGEMQPDIEDIIDAYISFNPSVEIEILPNCKQYPHIEQLKAFEDICSIYLA